MHIFNAARVGQLRLVSAFVTNRCFNARAQNVLRQKRKLPDLFVHFCSALYFSHDHPHDATFESRGQGKELLVRRDVMIPRVGIPEEVQQRRCSVEILESWRSGDINK